MFILQRYKSNKNKPVKIFGEFQNKSPILILFLFWQFIITYLYLQTENEAKEGNEDRSLLLLL